MIGDDIFKSVSRPTRDFAGVFEYDGEAGYFYLYDKRAEIGDRILGHIRIIADFSSNRALKIDVRWDFTENFVGLFIGESLRGCFDVERACECTLADAKNVAWMRLG